MNKTQRLESALDWMMRGNHVVDWGDGVRGQTNGCGCCAYSTQIPEDCRPELMASFARIQVTPSKPGDDVSG